MMVINITVFHNDFVEDSMLVLLPNHRLSGNNPSNGNECDKKISLIMLHWYECYSCPTNTTPMSQQLSNGRVAINVATIGS